MAAPASAQEPSVRTAAHPRPIGVYAGVEPGEAQPPPAFGRVTRRRAARGRRSEILTWPGFSPLGNGGSRFFVQTITPVVPELSVEQGRVVLLFRNTTIHLTNSRRWLETRFFNTPVLRARLERRGRHMALVMLLRPGVSLRPAVSSEAAPGANFHYVYIDFPPGAYAPVVTPSTPRASTVPPGGGSVRPSGPPAAPPRALDPSLDAMDDERPPGQ